MKRNNFYIILAFSSLIRTNVSAENIEKKPPNIIFFLADDMRYDAMGCAGNPVIKTPNLDQLAQNGIRFRNAFVTTSVCACSRASIFTGQYVSRHGIKDFQTKFTSEALQQTYPLLLKKAGYQIGFVGKYGIGTDTKGVDDQFDYFWGTADQPKYENKDENGNFIHYTDWLNRHVEQFLEKTDRNQPFYLSVCFKSPHAEDGDSRQFIYKDEYQNLYANDYIPEVKTNTQEEWNRFPAFFKMNNEARIRWELRFSNPKQYQESVKGYYRLINGLDEVIGNVRKWLKVHDMEENTIIILSSDNGFYLGEHALADKWYAHEPSIRVPLIIYLPQMPKMRGKIVKKMGLNIDLAPTILSLAGVDIPKTMQGKDLQSIIKNKEKKIKEWRTSFYYECTLEQFPTIYTSQALRSKRYKYIVHPNSKPLYEEVYDLKKDPNEIHNLALNSHKKKLIEGLKLEFRKEQLKAIK